MRHIALTIKQPYDSQILKGSKKIEYRSWQTHYRGDIVICASKSPKMDGLPTGCLICLAELYKITGDYGDYNWHLRNIRPLEQRPVQGKCKFFYLDIQDGDILDEPPPRQAPKAKASEKNQEQGKVEPIDVLRNAVKGLFSKAKQRRRS